MTTASAVICCWTARRWELLLAAVDSVLRQSVEVELLVVVDHDTALLRRLAATLPDRVTVLASDGPKGLSGARNTGVRNATGDVVLFLDDDAWAEPDWAAELLAAFEDPAVTVAGGDVRPHWDGGTAPAWFPAELGWTVGCSYRGQRPDPAQPGRAGAAGPAGAVRVRNPIGASMAVRRSAVQRVGGFAAALGRVGALPVGCEETELCLRIVEADPAAEILLLSGAAVHHFVPAERQRVGYLLRRCWHEGRSKAAVSRLVAARAVRGSARGASGSARGASRGALGAESAYASRVLPAALGRHLGRAARASGPDAVAAATVIGGLGAAVAGFAVESLRLRLRHGGIRVPALEPLR